ncbi:TetR/AcrR family transcriptional regulator [Ruegeria sediminis]|uniref:TetR/AcrR family transcriptional regulator n=1 Tax=Ruegeria sediminis TaxID=2583820 RepID=A0ABY2WYL2_9RHOB|nr:TetR/AcrR family transcriptional regulator [Ruegeria sediminis]TMV07962.1 TetR/AcrR family transcriptional regulator [Ruegeria sediminis]
MSSAEKNTRTRILDAAWTLLETNLGEPVRMSDIAREAGISRQALYLHFPTRAELLVETTLHIDEVKNMESRLTPSRSARSGEERLTAFVDAWGNYIPEIHGVGRALMAMQETDAEARSAWQGRMEAVRHGCAAVVRDLSRDGGLKPELDEGRATDLLWTLLSVRNWEHLVRDCGWSQTAYLETMQALARAALVKTAATD